MKLSSLPLLIGIRVTLGQAQWTPLAIPAKLENGATWKYQNTWPRGLAIWGSFVRDIRLTLRYRSAQIPYLSLAILI